MQKSEIITSSQNPAPLQGRLEKNKGKKGESNGMLFLFSILSMHGINTNNIVQDFFIPLHC